MNAEPNRASQEFSGIELEFLKHLRRINDDLQDTLKRIRTGDSSLIKSELCIALIVADSFSRYHQVYLGTPEADLDTNAEGRFKKWLSEFVLTNKNKIFREQKELIGCDVQMVWHIRNSLIHFYGLPNPAKTGSFVGFAGGTLEDIRKVREGFSSRLGQKVTVVHAHSLTEAILHGLLGQLLWMKEIIEKAPAKYIQATLIAHNLAMTEGSVWVDPTGSKAESTV